MDASSAPPAPLQQPPPPPVAQAVRIGQLLRLWRAELDRRIQLEFLLGGYNPVGLLALAGLFVVGAFVLDGPDGLAGWWGGVWLGRGAGAGWRAGEGMRDRLSPLQVMLNTHYQSHPTSPKAPPQQSHTCFDGRVRPTLAILLTLLVHEKVKVPH